MSNDKIISKIKKCLALSKSSNANEAQIALKQAQALMKQHQVSEEDIKASEACEIKFKAGAAVKPNIWELNLASKVAKAFAVEVIFESGGYGTKGNWCFIGCSPNIDIAEYAFKVLFRQCKRERKTFMDSKLKRCKPANKTRRADDFCLAWVWAVTDKIQALAASITQQQAIAAFMNKNYPTLTKTEANDRSKGRKSNTNDLQAGLAAGHRAHLNNAMSNDQRERISHG